MIPRKLLTATLTLLTAAFPFAAHGQEEGPVPTQVLVSVESKSAFTPNPSDVTAEVNGKATPITSLSPVPPTGLEVALLIDDGLRSSFGVQLQDVKKWILGLRPGTEVFVGYMQNGRVIGAQNFTTNYSAAANSVRLPMSISGANGSPYFSLSEFVKHWPAAGAEPSSPNQSAQPAQVAQGSRARVVLMITNGVDLYNGSVSPLNQDSPYVATAANDAQRAGVPVYSIYFSDRAVRGRFASFSGQNYLNQVADATGGRSFYQGTFNPVSLLPFFKQFDNALAQTYVATFYAVAHKKDTLVRLKLTSGQKGVKLHAPSTIHPGERETNTASAASM